MVVSSKQPSATLHLSYAFTASTNLLLRTRHIEHCALEASRANFCFHRLLVTLDVPPPKTAQHSREVLATVLGREIFISASRAIAKGRDALGRTCVALAENPTTAEMLVLDYSNSTIVASLHGAFSSFLGIGDTLGVPAAPSLHTLRLGEHFRSNPAVFLVYDYVQTEYLFHQDGDPRYNSCRSCCTQTCTLR